MHNFYFGGKWLSYFGGRLLQAPSFALPEREFQNIEILGQDGDEYVDNGRWKNVEFELQICFLPMMSQMSARQLAFGVIDWLSNLRGYQIFRDTAHPGYYTRAFITNMDSIIAELPTLLTTTIKFSREPWWHSDAGQKVYTLEKNVPLILNNPENYIAKPKILIERASSGSSISYDITINGKKVAYYTPTPIYSQIVIDGEKMQYVGNNGSGITFVDSWLPPDISPKSNVTVTATAVNTIVKFIPNWRRL